MIEQTLCIPPEKCGALNLPDDYDDEGDPILPTDPKERVKELTITVEMLEEALTDSPSRVLTIFSRLVPHAQLPGLTDCLRAHGYVKDDSIRFHNVEATIWLRDDHPGFFDRDTSSF